ncbi:MAG: hypothetical protein AAF098_18545, partial [Pseudomonadota bacterium]
MLQSTDVSNPLSTVSMLSHIRTFDRRTLAFWQINALFLYLFMSPVPASADAAIRVATFNVSMEGGNYVAQGTTPSGHELPAALSNSDHPQISNIAE